MKEALMQEAARTQTENGGAAYRSTGSACLDLFATIGALRGAEETELETRFCRAYAEDPDLAMKLLFFARDIRQGLGERRTFRILLRWLAIHQPESARKNLDHVAEYGRWDDLLELLDTPCGADAAALMKVQLEADQAAAARGEPVSLLAKWMPSSNASSRRTIHRARQLIRAFGWTERQYRSCLTTLRAAIRLLENDLRQKNYTFDYEKQPSCALLRYRKAFWRNDAQRYQAFLDRAAEGKAVLHAGNVAPYQLLEPYLQEGWGPTGFMRPVTPEEEATLNATWASLPDHGGTENALAVVDTSGSMYWAGKPLPAAVALSLGLYFAEHNRGIFHNCFIEFSARPQLIELKGRTFAEKLRYAASFNEVANTDLEAVFELVLRAAVRNHLPQEELPAKLVLISDMEFDSCVSNGSATQFENAKRRYAAFGYQLPQVVFWNVASRNRQQPVRQNEQGAVLVSGATPRLFAQLAAPSGTPDTWMREVLYSARYAPIAA